MHEFSLVQSIFRVVEAQYPGKMQQLLRVRVQAGVLSNVQPLLLQSAWQAALACRRGSHPIVLEVQQVPVRIKCAACGNITEVTDYVFRCSCGEPGRHIISGEELCITQLEFEADTTLPDTANSQTA